MKHWLSFFASLILSTTLLAQKPVIKAVVKNSESIGATVSIRGLNFGTVPANLIVFFGAAKGTVLTATDQLLEVQVPAQATFDFVSVTRLQASPPGLVAYSSNPFLLSFGGAHPFNAANLEAQKDFPPGTAEKGLYDLCGCDFDGDTDLDFMTANNQSTNLSLYTNTSTPGTINFSSPTLIPVGAKTLQLKCGDLNGDGLSDVVVSSGDLGNQLFILQNLGGTFSTQSVIMSAKGVLNVKISDLDLDGKPDLVVTHVDNSVLVGQIWVLKNETINSAIAFSAPITINVPEAVSTDGIDIADLDNDNFPEIVVSQRQAPTSNIYILKNTSTVGTISIGATTKMVIKGNIIQVKIADMDGNDKPDIIVTQVLNSTLSIFPNKSTLGNLVFDPVVIFPVETNPWGMDMGDLDGDGKVDITICSIKNKNLTILNNESTAGTFSFTKTLVPTTDITRQPFISDIDGDGKPDIAFTTIDDIGFTKQKLSVFRNSACMIPDLKPNLNVLALCTGASFKLRTTVSNGATYTWNNKTTNTVVGTNSPSFDIPTVSVGSNKYSVTVSPQAGGIACSTASSEIIINVSAGTATAATFVSPTGPVCVGSSLQLQVKDDGFTYKWTGPQNYVGATFKPAAIASFQAENAGRYFVDVLDPTGTCLSQRSSIVVEIIDALDFAVQFTGSALTCQTSKSLTVSPIPPTGSSYQWINNNIDIPGAAAKLSTYSALATGNYSVRVSTPSCDPTATSAVKIEIVSPPTPSFTFAPISPVCANQNITFTSSTIPDAQLDITQHPLVYTWTLGDGSSTEASPIHKYITATTYTNLQLKATYFNSETACEALSATQSITINPAPSVSITSSSTSLCPGDSLKLEVAGGPFSSYTWSNQKDTPAIYVKEGGPFSVKVISGSCTLDAATSITLYPKTLTLSVDPSEITEGNSAQLTATGLQNYIWSPADSLSDFSIADPIAKPAETTTYVVKGTDANGCVEKDSVLLVVKSGLISSKLKPAKYFTPNGDAQNPVWTIEKIEEYPTCGVAIYDDKGIKVYESKPYVDWDGTFHGRRLPDGVYYYIIRCEGEEGKPRSGSITLLR